MSLHLKSSSELVIKAEPLMLSMCALLSESAAIAVDHLTRAPTDLAHQSALRAAVVEPQVRVGVAELVGV